MSRHGYKDIQVKVPTKECFDRFTREVNLDRAERASFSPLLEAMVGLARQYPEDFGHHLDTALQNHRDADYRHRVSEAA